MLLGQKGASDTVEIYQLPAWQDNYIYVLHEEGFTVVIDPTEAQPVVDLCTKWGWKLKTILITHHHPDHIHGVNELKKTFSCDVYGYCEDQYRLPPLTHALEGHEQIHIGPFSFFVMPIPGHTLGHIAYYDKTNNLLFSGDALFSMGCGRLFEGTPEMAIQSLGWIRSLPANTLVHCTHEYTKTNTEFALQLEPDNQAIRDFYQKIVSLRKNNLPTVPFMLGPQCQLNPFLRWDDPILKEALNNKNASDVDTFRDVRERRNHW